MEPTCRTARPDDLPTLVAMLADDPLGAGRENASSPLDPAYEAAMRHIAADPNNELVVAEADGNVVAMLQLTFIPCLTHTGAWRCLIEGVRVHRDFRGAGVGAAVLRWAIERARGRGCAMAQLTSDKRRPEAIRFYEALGFRATHEGLKLPLGPVQR